MAARYRSTRGGGGGAVSFRTAVLRGLAPDGGLYVPVAVPRVAPAVLDAWRDLSFAALATEVLSLFVDEAEVPRGDLALLAERSFGAATFAHADVTPVVPLAGGLHVLELFHGPTFAFKDVALQFLGHLFEYLLEHSPSPDEDEDEDARGLTVLGATSGDTGSAAIHGLRGRARVQVVILHPHGRVSSVQALQMTTVLDANVHNVAVDGTFDDCQAAVKEVFADAAFCARRRLTAINSINWARIAVQTVYYFHAYNLLLRRRRRRREHAGAQHDHEHEHAGAQHEHDHAGAQHEHDHAGAQHAGAQHAGAQHAGAQHAGAQHQHAGAQHEHQHQHQHEQPAVSFAVPSGNFGDVLAGYYARRMGLPVAQLVVATNRNDVLPRFFATGRYARLAEAAATLSPAMDIQVASNFERFLFHVAGDDDVAVAAWMRTLQTTGELQLSAALLDHARATGLVATAVSDEDTLDAIRRYASDPRAPYELCPHTAVGVVAAERLLLPATGDVEVVCLATAHAAKFPEAFRQATGRAPATTPPALAQLAGLPTRCARLGRADAEAVKAFIERELPAADQRAIGP